MLPRLGFSGAKSIAISSLIYSHSFLGVVASKAAVIGLDGLCWSYLDKLLSHGAMPFTRALLQKSVRSDLYSYPPSTMPAWTSIMTGVNPGKHGVFGFYNIDLRKNVKRMYNALDSVHPRIHEMLAMSRAASITINPIPLYPILPLRGIHVIVHHFLAPRVTCYPKSLEKYAELLREVDSHPSGGREELLEKFVNKTDALRGVVEDLLSGELDWRLFWLMLEVPDHLLHQVSDMLDKTYSNEVRMFRNIDGIVKALASQVDYLIIVSDHGFTKSRKFISVNDALLREGLVVLEKPQRGGGSKATLLQYKIARKLLPTPVRRLLKGFYRVVKGRELRIQFPDIRISKSRAFIAETYGGLYVRDESLIARVVKCLSRIPGLKVLRREEVYWGPKVKQAPQILLYPDFDRGYNLANPKITGFILIEREAPAHHPRGVLVVHPKPPDLEIPRTIRTYHVAPLIMELLKLPLPHAHDVKWIKPSAGVANYADKWRIVRRVYGLRRILARG